MPEIHRKSCTLKAKNVSGLKCFRNVLVMFQMEKNGKNKKLGLLLPFVEVYFSLQAG